MKIAVWHNLPSGGGKRSLYHHVRGLLERGHTVESWCPSSADQTYLPISKLTTEHILPLSWKSRSSKVPSNRILRSYYTVTDKIEAMDEHCRQCADEINRGDFDILFVNPCTFFRSPSIAQYVKIPTVLYLQEPYRWLYEAMPRLPWLALSPLSKPWWRSPNGSLAFLKNLVEVQGLRVQAREELKNAQAFDLILVNSLFSRESVQRAYGLDSKVCYLGIDTDLFEPLSLPRQNMVVGLGAIYSGKGIERAIHAIGTIEDQKKPDLIWIGNVVDPHYQQTMKQLAQSLNVNFIPKVRIPDQEVIQLLNQATAMIYTPILEPFGFAPLEANACETPVVAIAEGGVRESVEDGINGFLIPGNEPDTMGQAVLRLLEDKKMAYLMGVRAREHVVNKWSVDAAINSLEQCLINLKGGNDFPERLTEMAECLQEAIKT
jgi:glycosyltransferase involved in cell wall biosynthesis